MSGRNERLIFKNIFENQTFFLPFFLSKKNSLKRKNKKNI
jgi:hypothetical protein